MPILLAAECSVCVSTLPVLVRHRPAARVLWLDAHGDFNTPQTSR
ncbi:MAG: arginase [Solirubrobacteraceae bacterium]|jgi:arginase family enzyme|nr:arginase [Solirubrobacteraceae bacterium]